MGVSLSGRENEYMSLPSECVRCGASSPVLFCPACAPESEIQQHAEIDVGAGKIRTKAQHRPDEARKPTREASVTEEFNHKRQQVERKILYIDRSDDLYIEMWQDLRTGEVTYLRRGALHDQSHHGPRTRARQDRRALGEAESWSTG